MMARIWLAVSDGESATERLWQTTQRSWAAIVLDLLLGHRRAPGGAAPTASAATSASDRRRRHRAHVRLLGQQALDLPRERISSVTAPTCLARIRPARSMKNVSGTP